ncbi:MAG: tetratricopeptide repeat protein [Candidatus Electrothrix scaldis]|nr:MAG: tetratricopeptide repeat protein [Candidatus Electrothrix sp. GW3-3]
MKDDCYRAVHRLLRKCEYDKVLKLIYDRENHSLNEPYSDDSNHGWYIVGDICFKKSDYKLAIKAFKNALTQRKDDSEALMALANCYAEIGKPQKAERYLRESIRIKPLKAYVYNLANALFDQGKFRDAIEMYEAILYQNKQLDDLARKNLKLAKKKRGKA